MVYRGAAAAIGAAHAAAAAGRTVLLLLRGTAVHDGHVVVAGVPERRAQRIGRERTPVHRAATHAQPQADAAGATQQQRQRVPAPVVLQVRNHRHQHLAVRHVVPPVHTAAVHTAAVHTASVKRARHAREQERDIAHERLEVTSPRGRTRGRLVRGQLRQRPAHVEVRWRLCAAAATAAAVERLIHVRPSGRHASGAREHGEAVHVAARQPLGAGERQQCASNVPKVAEQLSGNVGRRGQHRDRGADAPAVTNVEQRQHARRAAAVTRLRARLSVARRRLCASTQCAPRGTGTAAATSIPQPAMTSSVDTGMSPPVKAPSPANGPGTPASASVPRPLWASTPTAPSSRWRRSLHASSPASATTGHTKQISAGAAPPPLPGPPPPPQDIRPGISNSSSVSSAHASSVAGSSSIRFAPSPPRSSARRQPLQSPGSVLMLHSVARLGMAVSAALARQNAASLDVRTPRLPPSFWPQGTSTSASGCGEPPSIGAVVDALRSAGELLPDARLLNLVCAADTACCR
eukprot:362927-Chlamydomonas_euryale.AAC.7